MPAKPRIIVTLEIESYPQLRAKYEEHFSRKMGKKHLRILSLLSKALKLNHAKLQNAKIVKRSNWERLYIPKRYFAAISKRHYCRILQEFLDCGILSYRSGGIDRLKGYLCPKTYGVGDDIKGVCKFILFAKWAKKIVLQDEAKVLIISETFKKLPPDLDQTNQKDEACKHVQATYGRATISPGFHATSESSFRVAEKIHSGIADAKKTKTGRIYNTLVGPNSVEVRKHVLLDGQSAVEMDMKQAHPALIGRFLTGQEAKKWAELSSGDFYTAIGASAGIEATRIQLKSLFQAALTAPTGTRNTKRRKLSTYLRSNFPTFFAEADKHSSPQALLQSLEATLINKVVLHAANLNIPIIPLYDGFLCLPEHSEQFAQLVGLPMERK